MEVINDLATHHPLTDLIDDAYGIHNYKNHQPTDLYNVHDDQVNELFDSELP